MDKVSLIFAQFYPLSCLGSNRSQIVMCKKIQIILIIFSVITTSCLAMVSSEEPQSQEVIKVIQIAEKCLLYNQIDLKRYKLIKAENLYINNSKYIGPNKWYVVFKAKHLIPKDEKDLLGAGGEIFVEVDLKGDQAKILGYGE